MAGRRQLTHRAGRRHRGCSSRPCGTDAHHGEAVPLVSRHLALLRHRSAPPRGWLSRRRWAPPARGRAGAGAAVGRRPRRPRPARLPPARPRRWPRLPRAAGRDRRAGDERAHEPPRPVDAEEAGRGVDTVLLGGHPRVELDALGAFDLAGAAARAPQLLGDLTADLVPDALAARGREGPHLHHVLAADQGRRHHALLVVHVQAQLEPVGHRDVQTTEVDAADAVVRHIDDVPGAGRGTSLGADRLGPLRRVPGGVGVEPGRTGLGGPQALDPPALVQPRGLEAGAIATRVLIPAPTTPEHG